MHALLSEYDPTEPRDSPQRAASLAALIGRRTRRRSSRCAVGHELYHHREAIGEIAALPDRARARIGRREYANALLEAACERDVFAGIDGGQSVDGLRSSATKSGRVLARGSAGPADEIGERPELDAPARRAARRARRCASPRRARRTRRCVRRSWRRHQRIRRAGSTVARRSCRRDRAAARARRADRARGRARGRRPASSSIAGTGIGRLRTQRRARGVHARRLGLPVRRRRQRASISRGRRFQR